MKRFRSIAPPYRIDQAVDAFGRSEQLKVMTRFKWFPVTSPELDKAGVDHIWINLDKRIDIQLKSRNMDLRDRSYSWKLCESGENLNSNFYAQTHNYLMVIGFNRVEDTGEEFVPAQIVRIGLIPAKTVYEKLGTNKLTISDRKLESNEGYWSQFFGIDAIRRTLNDESLNQR